MIDFFKNLFNGIVSFLTGPFRGKKSEENKPSTSSPVEKLTEATSSTAEKLSEAASSTAEKLTEATSSTAQKLSEATSSTTQKLTEATSSTTQKLSEVTSSTAEKLTEATDKSNSGIVSSLTGLVGGKKSEENKPSTKAATAKKRKGSGYFMELNEAEEMKPVNGKQQAKVEAAKTPEPAAKTQATKPAKAELDNTLEPAAKKAKVEMVQTAEGVKAEPGKPAKAPAASANGQKQTENTFAPKYLLPSPSNSRRRPGPNMSTFLDMARQVKTPG